MPKRKRPGRNVVRRVKRRRTGRGFSRRPPVRRPLVSRVTPWPRRAFVTLDYVQSRRFVVNNITTACDFETLRTNSIWDPDPDAGGQTTRGQPQWAALYNQYRVIACKVDVWLFPEENSSDAYGCLFIEHRGTADVSSPVTVNTVMADIVGRRNVKFMSQGSANARTVHKLTSYRSIASIEGRRLRGEQNYESAMNGNPGRITTCNVGVCTARSPPAGTPREFNAVIKIRYYVQLWGRTNPTFGTPE